MATSVATRSRAPRGAKTVVSAFMAALDEIPDARRVEVAKAAQTSIRDEVKSLSDKAKETARKPAGRKPAAKKKAVAKKAVAKAPAKRAAPAKKSARKAANGVAKRSPFMAGARRGKRSGASAAAA